MKSIRHAIITILFSLLAVTITSCAGGPSRSWKAIPGPSPQASFDERDGFIKLKEKDYMVKFIPVPKLEKEGIDYQGSIIIGNRYRYEMVILWEDLSLSDSYGFFKKYRFGQVERLNVEFPSRNGLIPAGEERTYRYTMDSLAMKNAGELPEYSSYILKIPVRFSDSAKAETLVLDYKIRENR